MSEENTVSVPPPAPAAAPATVEHISALHKKIEELGHMMRVGFEALYQFLRREAPAVEAGAVAVSTVVPGVGPVAKTVAAAAAEVVAVVDGCCEHAGQPHGPNGCTAAGCSCPATN